MTVPTGDAAHPEPPGPVSPGPEPSGPASPGPASPGPAPSGPGTAAGPGPPPAARTGSARALGLSCAALVAAACLLWAGSVAVWFRVTPPGRPPVELTGAEVSGAPGAVALLALAGVAGLVATAGPLRRALGALLAAAGAATAVVVVRAALADPFAAGATVTLPPGTAADGLRGLPVTGTPASLLTVAGTALLLAVGLFVLVRAPRLASLGARYGSAAQRRTEADPDRAAWQELDEGRDPTIGPGPPRAEPG